MSEKVFIAEQETLLEVQKQTDALVQNLIEDNAPIYGMVIHEAADLDPSTRVEYLGANKDFTPMSMNMSTYAMNYGSWGDWEWLKANVPVMCNFDGGIDYYLNPDDYTKKEDGSDSDVANIDYEGDAMAVIKKIYKKEYKVGNDRYVYFCERKVDDDFRPVGFDVLGKERDYMLIPMFYGSFDSSGRMRSIAGQWSCLSASGNASNNLNSTAIGTTEQYTALQASSENALFFGGALTNTLADICIMLTRSTNSQEAFGYGMCSTYVDDASQYYGTQINTVVDGGQFYGSDDKASFNKIFHSCVVGSYMLWQRDPYMLLIEGRIFVSPDYTYSLTGDGYLDTGVDFTPEDTSVHYYPTCRVIKDFGAVPAFDMQDVASTALGYCDGIWANSSGTRVSLRFG
ncbi:MAG: hypothetical protein LUG91_09940, partial [Ruminococcus sp.]|nr:hypothetical protein [Ruminococcus sp.]